MNLNLFKVIRDARALRVEKLIHGNEQFYLNEIDKEEFWLKGLNNNWNRLAKNVEAYGDWVRRKDVPLQFKCISDFTQLIPICTKQVVRRNILNLIDRSKGVDSWKSTGGSTATPIKIPMWKSELERTQANQWLARSWHGLAPQSRLFMLWGHSHLFGQGITGWLNARKRELFDQVLGYCRFSAYDLSPSEVKRGLNILLRFKPEYIYGYSVALDRFARMNMEMKEDVHRLGIKRVQATAESFPYPDSREVVEEFFGCPVIMEYGAVETGVIAATGARGLYSVFWRDFFLEVVTNKNGSSRLLVTTLYPRALPLLRYDLGDLIELAEDGGGMRSLSGIQEFSEVKGRCFEGVTFSDGKFIHSGIFGHLVRDIEGVLAFQVHQRDESLCLHYIGLRELNTKEIDQINTRGRKVDERLARMQLIRVDKLDHTIAGKTLAVVVH